MRNLTLSMCVVCLALAISACANLKAVNKPLPRWTPEKGHFGAEQIAGDRSPEMLVLVAFSGGGTRAAAFSYGVLKELAETEVMTEKGPRPLLHEIDIIASVSGGSFTSAYYGLRGDRIFDEYEDRFLRKNVQGGLFWQVFRPINWFRLFSSTYGSSDIAAQYYDKHIFNNATFADIHRPDAPLLIINATDLASSLRFPFTQSSFDLICSDISQYPISRAVAASSAVPVLLSPITLKSYAGSCGYELPEWFNEAMQTTKASTSKKVYERAIKDYLDSEKRPWIHLVDGGIADNLGLRSFYQLMEVRGGLREALRKIHHSNARQILVISVISHASGAKKEWELKDAAPSLTTIIGSITNAQISRYSVDTIDIVNNAFEQWTAQISTPEHPVTFNFVEVSFGAVADETERDALNRIGTSFSLSDEEVDRLISAARKVLRESPEFQDFLHRNRDNVDEQ